MALLYCDRCKEVFDEDEADTYHENVGEFWGTPAYQEYYRCPHCGCEDVYDYNEEDDEEDDEE